jgi:hypothetical protein
MRNVPDAFSPVRTRKGMSTLVAESATKVLSVQLERLEVLEAGPHAARSSVGCSVESAIRLGYRLGLVRSEVAPECSK